MSKKGVTISEDKINNVISENKDKELVSNDDKDAKEKVKTVKQLLLEKEDLVKKCTQLEEDNKKLNISIIDYKDIIAKEQAEYKTLKDQNNNLFSENNILNQKVEKLEQESSIDSKARIEELEAELLKTQQELQKNLNNREFLIKEAVEKEVNRIKDQMCPKEQYTFILNNLAKRENELEDILNTCVNFNTTLENSVKLFDQILNMKINEINKK